MNNASHPGRIDAGTDTRLADFSEKAVFSWRPPHKPAILGLWCGVGLRVCDGDFQVKTIGLRIAGAASALMAMGAPLWAQTAERCWWRCGGGDPAPVPEIDMTTGVLAVAAVLAVTALVWERRRRARA